jgi:dTDP-4-dehydrorhamnose reductase
MILVFGKTGQLALELQRFADVTALGRGDVNLLNPRACSIAIKDYAPIAVINAAAYTDVDMAEVDARDAFVVNGDAPKEMAIACAELNIPFVHISTDYVFDGSGTEAWSAQSRASPINAYGRSKLLGEEGIRSSGAVYAIVRASWAVSSHGTNFVKSMLTLSENNSVLKVVSDQIGGPTPAGDIAVACLKISKQLIADSSKCGTYHLSGVPNVSWADFAVEIFSQSNKFVNVIPVPTTDYLTRAPRPLNSRMDCRSTELVFGITRPCWKVGLNSILKELEVIK